MESYKTITKSLNLPVWTKKIIHKYLKPLPAYPVKLDWQNTTSHFLYLLKTYFSMVFNLFHFVSTQDLSEDVEIWSKLKFRRVCGSTFPRPNSQTMQLGLAFSCWLCLTCMGKNPLNIWTLSIGRDCNPTTNAVLLSNIFSSRNLRKMYYRTHL